MIFKGHHQHRKTMTPKIYFSLPSFLPSSMTLSPSLARSPSRPPAPAHFPSRHPRVRPLWMLSSTGYPKQVLQRVRLDVAFMPPTGGPSTCLVADFLITNIVCPHGTPSTCLSVSVPVGVYLSGVKVMHQLSSHAAAPTPLSLYLHCALPPLLKQCSGHVNIPSRGGSVRRVRVWWCQADIAISNKDVPTEWHDRTNHAVFTWQEHRRKLR